MPQKSRRNNGFDPNDDRPGLKKLGRIEQAKRLARETQEQRSSTPETSRAITPRSTTKQKPAPARKQSRRVERAVQFRIQQATEATKSPQIRELDPCTPEFRLVQETLLAFPHVKRDPKSDGPSRTELAIAKAKRKLAVHELRQVQRIKFGERVVKRALAEAFDRIKEQPPAFAVS